MGFKKLEQDFDIMQLQLVFDTEEEKEEFMESMDTVKKILSGVCLKQLDNLALLWTFVSHGSGTW